MAKLHNYYILCPLIDQKSFLGVAKDRENEHVIISLGRNVVNKHRLSDQKQVIGWTSKDHITAPVVYDKDKNSYVSVFNKNTIKMWTDDNANLDKLKKYKFSVNILKLILRESQPPLVIFTNGNCASLPYAIENRKTYESKSLFKETDEIVEIECFKTQNIDNICYILKTSSGFEIAHCSIRDELGDMEKSKLTRVKITGDEGVIVIGKLINVKGDSCLVYVLWSDSKMTVYNLITKSWRNIGTVPWISTATSVSMAWMGLNHLILFGSNKDQEGAIIVAYNYVLGVGSCRYPMKMYRENAKLYCFNGYIILEASNHIGMLPFTLEVNRDLSSLLGSHEIIQNVNPEIADWDTPKAPIFKTIPEMEESVKLGITERTACAQILPTILEKNDTKALLRVIKEFKDIPESALATLVKYAVTSHVPDIAEHQVECKLLNEIFKILFCDALLIPHLRNTLTISDSLNLMKYILYLLFESKTPLDADYESRLYDWCALILDSFYQQYVISTDPNITKVLNHMSNYLNILIQQLFTVSDTIARLHKLLSEKESSNDNDDYLPYTIELMQI